MSGAYCTPDGHAVTHAMQPRQASKCRTNDGVIAVRPSSAGLHQVDAAARRVHLLAPQQVGRDTTAGRSRSARTCRSARVDGGSMRVEYGRRRNSRRLPAHRGLASQRSPAGVQDAVRIERALQRREQRLAVAVRSPDVDLLLELARSAQHARRCRRRRRRAQPLDGARLRARHRRRSGSARRRRRRGRPARSSTPPSAPRCARVAEHRRRRRPAASSRARSAPARPRCARACSRHSARFGVAVDDVDRRAPLQQPARPARPARRRRAGDATRIASSTREAASAGSASIDVPSLERDRLELARHHVAHDVARAPPASRDATRPASSTRPAAATA